MSVPARPLLVLGACSASASAVLGALAAPRHTVPGLWAIAILAFYLAGAWAHRRAPDSGVGARPFRQVARNPMAAYLVRAGTVRLLEESGEVEVVAAVGTAVELLDAVGRFRPDAVRTDIRMPPGHHMEGIEAAHQLRVEQPELGVVVSPSTPTRPMRSRSSSTAPRAGPTCSRTGSGTWRSCCVLFARWSPAGR